MIEPVLRRLALLLIATPLLSAAPEPLPAANPYNLAYAAVERLPAADAQALVGGKNPSASSIPLLAAITRSLAAGRTARSVAWTEDYQHFILNPVLFQSTAVAGIELANAEYASSSVVVERALDTLAFARHLGRNTPVVLRLTQRAIEDRTVGWLEKHSRRITSQDAGRFLSAMNRLPPVGNLANTLAVERMMFLDGQASDIYLVLPKLQPHATDGFTGRLRMAGIVTDGPFLLLGLQQDHASFWLKAGENKNGVTLLGINRKQDEALLVADGRLARLRLSSKTITPVDFSRLGEAVKTLPEDNPLRTAVEKSPGGDGTGFIRSLELAAREIGDLYAEALAYPEHFVDGPDYRARIGRLTSLAQGPAAILPELLAGEKKASDNQTRLIAMCTGITAPVSSQRQ